MTKAIILACAKWVIETVAITVALFCVLGFLRSLWPAISDFTAGLVVGACLMRLLWLRANPTPKEG